MTASPAASPWSPLRHATFRWLWLASIASNIGTWMHEVGAGWLMTSLSASPLHVALVQVAAALPMFFLVLPAGALADIVDKRRYLLVVQLWMSVVALVLALLSLSGLVSVASLLLLTLGLGVGTAMMMPAWSALVPELVGKSDLPGAVALSSVGINLSRAIGPALAFFLFASAGMALLPLIVRVEMQGSAADFGMLLGSIGVGAVAGAMLLPRLRATVRRDHLVAGASLCYAVTLLALAVLRNFYALLPVMLLSGSAWIAVLSSLQVAAQTSVPAWVRARALSVYILIFFGGMAAGSFLWGGLANHTSMTLALGIAAAGLALATLLTLKVQLPSTEAEDLAPSLHWPAPLLSPGMDRESGPVMVTLEYDIDPAQATGFQQAARELEHMRKRNGALSWALMQDSGNPRLWIEFFFEESWLEHLRHHQRVTRGELKIEAAVRHFQTAGVEIRVRHYLNAGS